MSKVTSKLQVTIPKALAVRLGIQPGDELNWYEAGHAMRVELADAARQSAPCLEERLQWFDQATERQRQRESGHMPGDTGRERGWTREELYDRGRSG